MYRIRILNDIMSGRECIRGGTILKAERCGKTNNFRASFKGHAVILFADEGTFELID
jgi:hypothetical protein